MPKSSAVVEPHSNQRVAVRHPIWILLLVVLIGVLLRSWRITNPVLDWHAFRQADTSSVTREFVKNGVDLLHPRYHDLSNIQSGKDNLDGYRMVEFPLINGLAAGLVRVMPFLSIELTSRLLAILASALTTWLLYETIRLLLDRRIALTSMIAFAVMPYAVFYGRVILPEPFLLLFAIMSLWFFILYHQRQTWWSLVGFTISLAIALLLKPFVVFYAPFFIAIHGWWWFTSSNKKQASLSTLLLVVAAVLSLLPFWWWRNWIVQFPSGIPASDWLFNSNGIRWRPAWFRWLGYERLTKLLLGYTGLLFFLTIWFSRNQTKLVVLLASWWLGIFAYLSIIASGNVQHDYYQVLMIPVVALTVGSGAVALFDWLRSQLTATKALTIVISLAVISWVFAWRMVAGYFNVNHWEYIEAGRAADQHIPADAKIIAPAFGDTMFLYQTNRTGWPIGFEIDQKIKLGATHYITTSYDDEARELEKNYTTIVKSDLYLLLDLTRPITSPAAQPTNP
jgi:hypothetical protein